MNTEKSVFEKFLEGEFDKTQVHDPDNLEDNISLTDSPKENEEIFYQDPDFTKIVNEFMDITDTDTRKSLINLDEASQNNVLNSLTSKLYDNIVDKSSNIDFGDIPKTKGDFTKLPNFSKLVDTITLLRDILNEYKQDTTSVDIIATACECLVSRKDLFMKAYRYNAEMPILMYNTIGLAVITSTSYMIATCIEFIKTPKEETFNISLDQVALKKTKDHLLYSNLKRFVDACNSGDMDKAMNEVINQKLKGFTGMAVVGVAVGAGILGVATLSYVLINVILPILRETTYFFYHTQTRVSEFFDIQADLLQVNAHNLEYNEMKQPEEKDLIVKKQMKVVDFFRKLSRKFSINGKNAEVETNRDITNDSKKMKISDIDSGDTSSSLF